MINKKELELRAKNELINGNRTIKIMEDTEETIVFMCIVALAVITFLIF